MTPKSSSRSGSSELELPGRLHPVLAMLSFLPMMTIILIVLGFAVEKTPPIALLILFAIIIVCCLGLSMIALKIMLGGKIKFESDGLTVQRFLSHETYPWASLDGCKVTPATGTFGDDPLADVEERVGLGLFLKNSIREREHDLDCDVVLCAGDKINVQPLMQLAKRIEVARKKAGAPQARTTAGVPATAPRRQFQQRAHGARRAAGGPPADPVAAFRQRAAAEK